MLMLAVPRFAPAPRPHASGEGRRRGFGLVCGIAAGALLVVLTGAARAATSGILHLRCTNPASGASWPLVVDLDRGLVGPFSAAISSKWISWRDPGQGFFDLERATGGLRLRNASSTGGYFLYYTCRPE